MIHFSLPRLLIYNFPLQQGKSWLLPAAIHLLICSVPVQLQNHELGAPWERALPTAVQCSGTAPLIVSPTAPTLVQVYLGPYLTTHPHPLQQESQHHTFVI